MKRIERTFAPGDRYKYDFGVCSYANGWAQVDTGQDACYFGTWVNPELRQTLCYCEGDVTRCYFDTDAELVEEFERIKAWNDENGHKHFGIDLGFGDDLKKKLIDAGLGPFLHKDTGNNE